MKLTILGCGTSFGVPRIGGDWGACDPAEPKNRRRRVSILIEHEGTRILVDTGPDLREQLLDARVAALDAVIWTHDHADHVHGLDDLRQIYQLRGAAVPAYARPATLATLVPRFAYLFEGGNGYPPIVTVAPLPDALEIGGIAVKAVDQPHGPVTSTGLRFEAGGASAAYSTDCNELTGEMAALFKGVDLWVVDALRRKPHATHAHLQRTLEWVERVGPNRAILTHMDNSMDYRTLRGELPQRVEPGFDGMAIDLEFGL